MVELMVAAPRRQDTRAAVLERLLAGALKPGTRLNESRLADELAVSRTPVREALLQLEREGFLRAERNRGFVVRALDREEARELYPILAALEVAALRQGFRSARGQVEALRELNAELARADGPGRALECDTAWHSRLLASCPNRRLRELIASQRLLVKRYELIYMSSVGLIPRSLAQHEAVAQALEIGDLEAACRALDENWCCGLEDLILRLEAEK